MKKMKLITEVKIAKDYPKISHKEFIFLLGSCFSENIFKKLKFSKFSVSSNPFGISFNPISIHNQLHFLLKDYSFSKLRLETKNDYHFSYLFSRAYCLPFNTVEELKTTTETIHKAAKSNLEKSKVIFLTYGTSWIYELKSTSSIVNNCHKQDANLFKKRLLTVSEIVDSFKAIHPQLEGKNVIFTVSPVRHQKDGLHQNQLSKSTLHLAIEEICKLSANYFYFPSYEIVLDELRDYRFFDRDLLHPNDMAIDYLWEKFQSAFLDDSTRKIVEEISALQASLNHKSFRKDSDEDKLFKAKLKEKIIDFEKRTKISF